MNATYSQAKSKLQVQYFYTLQAVQLKEEPYGLG
jgi:hypothetical protein